MQQQSLWVFVWRAQFHLLSFCNVYNNPVERLRIIIFQQKEDWDGEKMAYLRPPYESMTEAK